MSIVCGLYGVGGGREVQDCMTCITCTQYSLIVVQDVYAFLIQPPFATKAIHIRDLPPQRSHRGWVRDLKPTIIWVYRYTLDDRSVFCVLPKAFLG